jgi:glycosyltransferase involved in cell wall biosynthesis
VLSVLMPVYNEERTVERAIRDVLAADVGMDMELIVVDDGSTDGTSEILARGGWPDSVRLLRHERNQGKGAAVRTALAQARGEYSAIFDADLEYEPSDLGQLLPPLVEGRTNAVFGVRAFDGYTSHSFLFVLGNRGVTLIANIIFNVYLRDLMTCHKVIRTDVFKSLPLEASGFTIEPEIAARLLQRGERIFELPVHYKARGSAEGKKLTAVDGLRVVGTLLRCRFTPNQAPSDSAGPR